MLTPGRHYVISIGKRYLRFSFEPKKSSFIIVTRQIEFAHVMTKYDEALEMAEAIAAQERANGEKLSKKPVRVLSVNIETVHTIEK